MKTTYANGDVYSASDVNDITGTINLLQTSTLSSSAGKNFVINGGFDIWQRGTSGTANSTAAGAGYNADRWQNAAAGNAITVSRQATSDTTNLASIQYCARVQRNSGQTGTQPVYLAQSFETTNSIPLVNKTVTLSFYARRGSNFSATSNVLSVYLQSGTGTDQNVFSTTGFAYPINNQTATLTTTWQRFTYTGTIAATATELGMFFTYTPTGTASTNDYFEITGVQLELGSYATTFSRAGGTIQGELAACQRYYYRQTAAGITEPYAFGSTYNTTGGYVFTATPVTMRVKPTSIEFSNVQISDWINNFASTPTIGFCVNNQVWLNFGGTGMTGNRPYVLNASNATSFLAFNSEL
jgi:hypothetical protein